MNSWSLIKTPKPLEKSTKGSRGLVKTTDIQRDLGDYVFRRRKPESHMW